MRDEDEDRLPEIHALPTEVQPPASLERDALRRLRAEGLLAPSRARLRLALAAALLAGLAVGLAAGSYLTPGRAAEDRRSDQAPPPSPPRFALFLWQGDSYRPAAAPHARERVAEYGRWAAALRAEGRTVSGEKLADETRLVLTSATPEPGSASAPPRSSLLGDLAGYFVLEAANLDEAKRLAASCPHLEYGGAIEVRRIEG